MYTDVNRVQAVERTFQLLDALRELDGAGITELSAHTGLANSTIHRHLSTLVSMGHVVKDDDTYRMGLSFLRYGEYVQNRETVFRLSERIVEEIANETGERCQFLTEEHGRGVYVHISTGRHAVETDSQLGEQVYLHSTSIGWAILAHLPEERVDEIIDRWGMPALTENTLTTRDELLAEIARVREEGVAYNRGGNVQGLWSIGVPVMGPDGHIVGALSVSGPQHRMRGDRFAEEFPNLLLGAANELELNLKYAE